MRTAYRVLAYAVAGLVMVQAMVMVFAIDGLGKWVDGGGVLDKVATASDQQLPFPEAVGFSIHGVNGMMVIPLTALLLVLFSFFVEIPGATKWAGLVLLLVATQIALGLGGHAIPALGALHGLNALLLFSAAVYTARRERSVPAGPATESGEPVATPISPRSPR
jgi:hypothetical protein